MTVGSSPEAQSMGSALQSLKTVINKQSNNVPLGQMRFRPDMERVSFAASSLQLPPIEIVTTVLRERDGGPRPDQFFEICFPYAGIEKFKDILKTTYFSTSGYSTATAILVNGGLYYLFLEICSAAKRLPSNKEVDPVMYANMLLCKDNLEVCLDNLEMLNAATDENICALLLGATYAVECSKPSLCWSLTSAAIGLAQSLGYHRADSPCPDPALRPRRSFAFGSLYILDKSLSLRLGRASTIQDFDVTVEFPGYPSMSGHPSEKIWTSLMSTWISFASIQGRIYEKLYSPAALNASAETRKANAMELAQETEELRETWNKVDVDSIDREKGLYYAQAVRQADYVSHLATLTLIHRAASSTAQPTEQCIEYARRTIDAHQDACTRYRDTDVDLWDGYIHWAVIHAPFTPFIVLFCHVIATSDLNDLKRLGEFADSLQSATGMTEAAAKFHRLCHIFYQVATQYVEAKARNAAVASPRIKESPGSKDPVPVPYPEGHVLGLGVPWGDFAMTDSVPLSEFDQYLGALGFAPQQNGAASNQGTTHQNSGEGGDHMAYDAAGLENWFQGNQYMMNLLEQDLSYLDTMPQQQ